MLKMSVFYMEADSVDLGANLNNVTISYNKCSEGELVEENRRKIESGQNVEYIRESYVDYLGNQQERTVRLTVIPKIAQFYDSKSLECYDKRDFILSPDIGGPNQLFNTFSIHHDANYGKHRKHFCWRKIEAQLKILMKTYFYYLDLKIEIILSYPEGSDFPTLINYNLFVLAEKTEIQKIINIIKECDDSFSWWDVVPVVGNIRTIESGVRNIKKGEKISGFLKVAMGVSFLAADVISLGQLGSLVSGACKVGAGVVAKEAVNTTGKKAVVIAAQELGKNVGKEATREVASLAAKEAGKKAAKEVASQAAKEAGKKAAKEVASQAAKEVGKIAAEELGKKAAKEVASQAAKEVGKKAAEVVASQATKEVGKKAAKEIASLAAKEVGKIAAEELGKKAAKEIASQAAKEVGKKAAKVVASQAAKEVGKKAAEVVASQATKEVGKKAAKEIASLAAKKVGKIAAEEVGKKAAKEVASQAAKEVGKKAAKVVASQAAKEVASQGAKEVGKKAAKVVASQAAKEVGKKAAKEVVSQVAKEVGKKAAEETVEYGAQQLGKNVVETVAKGQIKDVFIKVGSAIKEIPVVKIGNAVKGVHTFIQSNAGKQCVNFIEEKLIKKQNPCPVETGMGSDTDTDYNPESVQTQQCSDGTTHNRNSRILNDDVMNENNQNGKTSEMSVQANQCDDNINDCPTSAKDKSEEITQIKSENCDNINITNDSNDSSTLNNVRIVGKYFDWGKPLKNQLQKFLLDVFELTPNIVNVSYIDKNIVCIECSNKYEIEQLLKLNRLLKMAKSDIYFTTAVIN